MGVRPAFPIVSDDGENLIAPIHAGIAAIQRVMLLMSMVLVSYGMIVMRTCGFKTAAFSFGNVADIPFGRLTVYNVLLV